MAIKRSRANGLETPRFAVPENMDFDRGDLLGVAASFVGVVDGVVVDLVFVGVCLGLRVFLLDDVELIREKRKMSCFCCVWLAR